MSIVMRYPGLASTFRNLVLIASAAAPGCTSPGECPDQEGSLVLTAPLDAELQALVDACRAHQANCEPMCVELLERMDPWDEVTVDEVVVTCELDQTTGTDPIARWTYTPACIGGRRPAGYARADHDLATVGGFFAEQARLESASVIAFDELAIALAAHRAPRLLIDACRRAAADEAVHAILCARIARQHGATPRMVTRAAPAAIPTLEALAHANAVEGCVREGWAALVATWQAGTAADPAIRAAMQRIAPDETAHATLSRAIDRWARRRLSAAAIARLDAARTCEIQSLVAAAAHSVPAALVVAAGLPDATTATRLIDGMRTHVWAA